MQSSEELFLFNIALWIVISAIAGVAWLVYLCLLSANDPKSKDPFLFNSPDMQVYPPIETKDWLQATPVF